MKTRLSIPSVAEAAEKSRSFAEFTLSSVKSRCFAEFTLSEAEGLRMTSEGLPSASSGQVLRMKAGGAARLSEEVP